MNIKINMDIFLYRIIDNIIILINIIQIKNNVIYIINDNSYGHTKLKNRNGMYNNIK